MARYRITDIETGHTWDTDDSKSVVPYSDSDDVTSIDSSIAENIISGRVPFHIQKLMDKATALGLTNDEVEYEYSVLTGAPAKDFSDFVNHKVRIIGATIIPHPAYKGKSDPEDAPLRPGYLKCLFAIDEVDGKPYYDIDGNPTILECSGVNVFEHTQNMLNVYGWYLWSSPKVYSIKRGGNSNAYYLRSTERPTPKQKVKETK